jgi:hypothetical protein
MRKTDQTARKADQQTLEAMAVELHAVLNLTLKAFGMSSAQRRRSSQRALALRQPPRASGALRSKVCALAALTSHWSNHPDYLDEDGRARTIPIKGAGPTFETLVRRFMAPVSLPEALELACQSAKVIRRPGGKIALTGGPLVSLIREPQIALAQLVRQVDYMCRTILENHRRLNNNQAPYKTERLVAVPVPKASYEQVLRRIHAQFCELTECTVSTLLREDSNTAGSGDKTLAIFGLYASQEDDFKRYGYPISKPASVGTAAMKGADARRPGRIGPSPASP